MTDESSRQILIKNIPYAVSEDELFKWCSKFGPVAKCCLKLDRFRHSRGFAFVTYKNIDGYDKLLDSIPQTYQGRNLYIKPANGQLNSNETPSNFTSNYVSQPTSNLSTNENFNSTTIDNSFMYDDDNHNRLASLRDELEANLECMQIAHEHEIKILRDKLTREKKLYKDAEELYREAEEDWRKVQDENLRLRTSLIKNVMQTFNIRKNFARQAKEQLKQCALIEKQYQDMK